VTRNDGISVPNHCSCIISELGKHCLDFGQEISVDEEDMKRFSGFGPLFGLAEKACIYRHPATFPTLETKVVDPILATPWWLKAFGSAPVASSHPTLNFADTIRFE
jgi:hypothetical protein